MGCRTANGPRTGGRLPESTESPPPRYKFRSGYTIRSGRRAGGGWTSYRLRPPVPFVCAGNRFPRPRERSRAWRCSESHPGGPQGYEPDWRQSPEDSRWPLWISPRRRRGEAPVPDESETAYSRPIHSPESFRSVWQAATVSTTGACRLTGRPPPDIQNAPAGQAPDRPSAMAAPVLPEPPAKAREGSTHREPPASSVPSL